MLSKNAIKNMKNRYSAVLKKCRLLNAFGSLALIASVLCVVNPAFAATPDVTVTTQEYVDAHKNNYYTTYEVPSYDATNGTYITSKYGVLLKGGNIFYNDISVLTKGLITETTTDNGSFTSLSTEGSSTYSFTVDGVTYNVVGAFQTGSRQTDLAADIKSNFIGVSGDANGGAIYNQTSNSKYTIKGDFIGNSASLKGNAFGGAIYNADNAKIGDITGSFIGNYVSGSYYNGDPSSPAPSFCSSYGGAIYNTGTIDNITGAFIGNYAIHKSGDDGKTSGGAIYNTSYGNQSTATIDDITASFIGNYARGENEAKGGAICNISSFDSTTTISYITGSFIGNYARSTNNLAYGGAIYNYSQGRSTATTATTIGNITGNFIGNYASGSTAQGGAIYIYNQDATAQINNITGSFIGNYARGEDDAEGGAIYNDKGQINNITGSFIGNYASGSDQAVGGAIYNLASTDDTTGNLTFLVDNTTNIFTDNYTSDRTGKTYNFIASCGGSLTFKMEGTGSFILNDSIVKASYTDYSTSMPVSNEYTMEIAGSNQDDNIFYLNAGISGVSDFSITGATLYIGSYLHADKTTRTYGSIRASKSLKIGDLIADVAYYDGALLQGNGSATLTVADNSTFTLVNASAGSYTIAENFASGSHLWSEENITLETSLLGATVSGDGMTNAYTVAVKLNKDSSLLDGPTGTLLGNVANHTDFGATAEQADLRFVYNATNTNTVGSTHTQGAIIEGNAQQATVAGTNANSYLVNRTATDVLHGRYSSLNNAGLNTSYSAMNVVTYNEDGTIKAEYGGVVQVAGSTDNLFNNKNRQNRQNTIDVWAMPMYTHENVKGMSAGSYSSNYTTDVYGMAVGVDKTIRDYGFADAYRLGLSFNVGTGETTTSGDFDNMTNDFDFFGLTAYGAMQVRDFTFSTDFGYIKNTSDIKQDLSAYAMDSTYSEVDSDVWHVALHGEYAYQMDSVTAIPYVGLELITMKTDDYQVKSAHGTIYDIENERQNIVSVPVGVRIEKEIETESGWSITPEAKVGAIFSFGDLDAHSTARMPSVEGVANMSTEVVDKATFDAGLGVSVAKENIRFAFEYDLQVSDNRTAHGVMGIIEYTF